MSIPSIEIVPAVGCSKPAIIRRVVVLPQPDGPRNDTNSPFWATRLKSSTATDRPKRFWIPVRVRKVIGSSLVRSMRAGELDLVPGRAPHEGEQTHRDPGQGEADERDGGRLVRLVAADERDVRAERRPGEERRDRELTHDDRQGKERATEQRHPEVREDDPPDEGEPARSE